MKDVTVMERTSDIPYLLTRITNIYISMNVIPIDGTRHPLNRIKAMCRPILFSYIDSDHYMEIYVTYSFLSKTS
jgi:hypothetical protein